MALAPQLENQFEGFKKNAPQPVQEIVGKAMKDHISSFKPENAIQIGDQFPSFTLPNAVGENVSSADLLGKGPMLISFYRGEWCPFCNLEVAALQARLGDFQAKGVTLVAVSPELPNGNLTMTEKHALQFPVLSDKGNTLARKLGIVFKQPDSLRPIFDKFGHDLVGRNGDDSFEVPVPATFLVDRKGVVKNSFVDPNYIKRLEPSTALEWVDALQE
jgi:peroxiredoxin